MLAELGLHYETTEFQTRFVGLPNGAFYSELAKDYATLDKGPFPDDFHDKHNTEVWKLFERDLKAIDGIRTLVEGYSGRMAVGSSSSLKSLPKKMNLTGLYDLFAPHIYSGDLVEHGKPAPDLFLYAAARIDIDPQDCAVIEDSVNGIKAAVAAGMFAIGFTGGKHADADLANRLYAAGAGDVVSSHNELCKRFHS